MDGMSLRRGLLAQMSNGSNKYRAVINNEDTHIVEITGYGTKQLSRLFNESNVKVVYMPGFEKLDLNYYFHFMPNLEAAIFPDATSFVPYLFWNTNKDYPKPGIDIYKKQEFPNSIVFRLDQGADIILRASEMSTTGFNASTWGVSEGINFYVPSDLIDTYLADTNWSTFGSSRILPIEGSKYEDMDWWKSIT